MREIVFEAYCTLSNSNGNRENVKLRLCLNIIYIRNEKIRVEGISRDCKRIDNLKVFELFGFAFEPATFFNVA